jgi:hypothetical protein
MPRKPKITKKKVELEIGFFGNGTIVESPPNSFSGGIPDPDIRDNLFFGVSEELPEDENGPLIIDTTYDGTLNIQIWGSSEGYRELARYLLALAELDTGTDNSFHIHHEAASMDGRTQLRITVRKPMEDGEFLDPRFPRCVY